MQFDTKVSVHFHHENREAQTVQGFSPFQQELTCLSSGVLSLENELLTEFYNFIEYRALLRNYH